MSGQASVDLRPWGWAPGGYSGPPCADCRTALEWCAKRAWRCEPCARVAMEAELMARGPSHTATNSDAEARRQAERDMATLGVGFLMIRPEGFERLDPARVIIKPGGGDDA